MSLLREGQGDAAAMLLWVFLTRSGMGQNFEVFTNLGKSVKRLWREGKRNMQAMHGEEVAAATAFPITDVTIRGIPMICANLQYASPDGHWQGWSRSVELQLWVQSERPHGHHHAVLPDPETAANTACQQAVHFLASAHELKKQVGAFPIGAISENADSSGRSSWDPRDWTENSQRGTRHLLQWALELGDYVIISAPPTGGFQHTVGVCVPPGARVMRVQTIVVPELHREIIYVLHSDGFGFAAIHLNGGCSEELLRSALRAVLTVHNDPSDGPLAIVGDWNRYLIDNSEVFINV